MPFKKCKTSKGKTGVKWGDKGKCYTDKTKADKQRKAIKASQNKRKRGK